MWKFFALACILQAPWITLQQNTPTESRILQQALDQYNVNNRPTYKDGGPVTVTVNFYLRNFQKIDSTMEENEMELTFRQKWNDPRLSYNDSDVAYVTLRDVKKIWVPDLFFSNSKSGFFHNLMEPNTLMRIHPNGDVLYSSRVSVVTRCITDWRYYPFAKINCPLMMASYGYTTDTVQIEWKEKEPIQIAARIKTRPHSLHLVNYLTKLCTSRTNTGEYGCLKGEIIFDLKFGPYFATLFLPSMVSVILAWFSFWIDKRGVGASMRLSLLMFTLTLSLFAWLITLYQSPVTYITNSSHIWSGISFLFNLLALLHYYFTSAVPCCQKLMCGAQPDGSIENNADAMKPMIMEDLNQGQEKKKSATFSADHLRTLVTRKNDRPDMIARIFYPSLYLVFNIIFWAVYNEKDEF